MMRVINIAVNNKDYFIELLIRDLISEGISYVQIENEFHFLDHIYRFYDVKQDREQIKKLSDAKNIFSEIALSLNFLDFDEPDRFLGVTVAEGRVYNEFPVKPSRPNMKKMIKQQNRMVNQRLRQNKR